jgi:hypothetical protein
LLVYAFSLVMYDYAAAWMNMTIFFVLYPVLGYATILVGDVGIDIAKSLPPLLVSLGNTLSSSAPLRELRKKLKDEILKLVQELGPVVFPDFEETKLNAPGHAARSWGSDEFLESPDEREAFERLGDAIAF